MQAGGSAKVQEVLVDQKKVDMNSIYSILHGCCSLLSPRWSLNEKVVIIRIKAFMRPGKNNEVIFPLFLSEESVSNYLAFSGMNRGLLKLGSFI